MAGLKLEVVTPTGRALEATVSSVTAPGVVGEFTVLPQHRPGLIKLSGGAIRYEGEQGAGLIYIRGGLAEVAADRVLVLADEAKSSDQVDRAAAEALLERVTNELADAEFMDDERATRLNSDRAYAESILKAAGH